MGKFCTALELSDGKADGASSPALLCQRIVGWFGLEETLKIICSHGQGHLPLSRAAPSPAQPWLYSNTAKARCFRRNHLIVK